jgi:hypothetical protein
MRASTRMCETHRRVRVVNNVDRVRLFIRAFHGTLWFYRWRTVSLLGRECHQGVEHPLLCADDIFVNVVMDFQFPRQSRETTSRSAQNADRKRNEPHQAQRCEGKEVPILDSDKVLDHGMIPTRPLDLYYSWYTWAHTGIR